MTIREREQRTLFRALSDSVSIFASIDQRLKHGSKIIEKTAIRRGFSNVDGNTRRQVIEITILTFGVQTRRNDVLGVHLSSHPGPSSALEGKRRVLPPLPLLAPGIFFQEVNLNCLTGRNA
jgi:hypothetical protein